MTSERRINFIWLVLAAATALTWLAGETGSGGRAIVAFVFALALIKGGLVSLDFMELRHAPPLWRGLVLGWLLFVTASILIAYLIGQP